MRIKRIEVDGFKSYAQKQVIDGFDATFNAITGLNGSGKSNILDSICFVLGITNLTQVRATQLQDLVYKQGQAGVTKATVSITFDNTDDSNKPLGYDRYDEIVVRRQVIIGGRNTYTINGTAATNQRVADLFRSVGLNGDLQRLNFSEAAEQELENERLQLEREVGRLKDELQHFEARHPNLRFIYQDPRSGFDRNAVKGLVAKLIRMKEMRDALAVEIAAGVLSHREPPREIEA
uniref:RecF/RecN/SMC N-terminal domain-containing protein n=1 Tax=Plectus sambesii TaxID=2011161 RepID=A0A914WLN7_9BILA